MRRSPPFEPITMDQFLGIDFASDRKYELVDGVIRMMTGGTPAHARVAGNILRFLYPRLGGAGCRPHGVDMGLCMSGTGVRYPDVDDYCGDPASPERERERVYSDPEIQFEVLSPRPPPATPPRSWASMARPARSARSPSSIRWPNCPSSSSGSARRHGATTCSRGRATSTCQHRVSRSRTGLASPRAEMFARD